MEEVNTDNGNRNPLRLIQPGILAELNHLDLSNSVTCSELIGAGTYGDVLKGQCLDNTRGRGRIEVAIKRLRFYIKEDIILRSMFWLKLKHPNILPLLGFAFDSITGYPLLVSEWMKNGTAWSYVNANRDCDVLKLITDIANGLEYLHSDNIVHSDIKSDNVVISDSYNALICDFGCARIVEGSRSWANMSSGLKGTTRYMAYELIVSDGSESPPYSTQADVWAFGMTVLELLTRLRPYHNLQERQVSHAILSRKSPFASLQEEFFSSKLQKGLMDLCLQCWNPDPDKRTKMSNVRMILHNLARIHDDEESRPPVDTDSLAQFNHEPELDGAIRSEAAALDPEPHEKRKYSRVDFEQLTHLERFFAADRSLTAARRKEISELLGMQENQTQNWFQNRRAKAKWSDSMTFIHLEDEWSDTPPGTSPQSSAEFGAGLHLIHEDQPIAIIPCTDLSIGSWRHTATGKRDLLAYICEASHCLTWFIHAAECGLKMEIPFGTIKHIEFRNAAPGEGLASFHLSRPPNFYLKQISSPHLSGSIASSNNALWKQCSDWTEDTQASQVLRHDLFGNADRLVHFLSVTDLRVYQARSDTSLLSPPEHSSAGVLGTGT